MIVLIANDKNINDKSVLFDLYDANLPKEAHLLISLHIPISLSLVSYFFSQSCGLSLVAEVSQTCLTQKL